MIFLDENLCRFKYTKRSSSSWRATNFRLQFMCVECNSLTPTWRLVQQKEHFFICRKLNNKNPMAGGFLLVGKKNGVNLCAIPQVDCCFKIVSWNQQKPNPAVSNNLGLFIPQGNSHRQDIQDHQDVLNNWAVISILNLLDILSLDKSIG